MDKCILPKKTSTGKLVGKKWVWEPQEWLFCRKCKMYHGTRHIPDTFWKRKWENDPKKGTAGVILTRKNGWDTEFFLVQCYGNFYSFPKGKVECGETYRQAAQRELREETGIRDSLENCVEFRQSVGEHKRISLYHMRLDKDVKINVPRDNCEVTGYGWVSSRKIRKLRLNKVTSSFLDMWYRFN